MQSKNVRTMDKPGQIVLPRDLRNKLGWTEGQEISITIDENKLILQSSVKSCSICGNEKDITPVKSKIICKDCISEINKD